MSFVTMHPKYTRYIRVSSPVDVQKILDWSDF